MKNNKYAVLVTYCTAFLLVLSCSPNQVPSISKEDVQNLDLQYTFDEDVSSVVRDFSTTIEIASPSEASIKIKKTVTVLNSSAKEQGFLVLGYDKFRKIESVNGAIYDQNGEFVRSLSDRDMVDVPNTSSYSLYEDNRAQFYELTHDQYPYTVVYEYETKLVGLINLPSWYPQEETTEYTEQADLKVVIPSDLALKYEEQNFDGESTTYQQGSSQVYEWSIEDRNPPEVENYGPNFALQIPRVLLATEKFSLDGNEGSLESWSSFGKWYYDLNDDRQQLSPDTEAKVKEIIDSTPDYEERVKKLYEFMQDRSRYVSIQLGIGGWQTFPASFVESTSYGDCKALTNYMHSLLKYAEIPSFPVLIRNGRSAAPIAKDFPSNQFNHVVLAVPAKQDTLWLECTSQDLPFNYISSSNANRDALLVSDEGSKIVQTPVFDENVNTQYNNLLVNLSADGRADLTYTSENDGFYLEYYLYNLIDKSPTQRRSWLENEITLASSSLVDFDLSEVDERKAPINIVYKVNTGSYANNSGSRMFIPVNRLNQWNLTLGADLDRKQEIDLKYAFTEKDSIQIHIPEGYYVEAIPEDRVLETEFGRYELKILPETQQGIIFVTRELILNREKLRPEEYNDLRVFLNTVSNTDNQEIVINKKS